jgi:hypothetical protein
MPRVQLPDGRLADFPDTMSTAEIEAVLRRQFPPPSDRPAGLPAGVDLPQLRTRIPPPDAGSTPGLASAALGAGNVLGNLGTGLGESIAGTLSNLNPLLNRVLPTSWTPPSQADLDRMTPVEREAVRQLNPAVQQQQLLESARPENTTQAIGKTLGDIAQFLMPAGAEEAVAAGAAPYVGRALPLLKMGLAGLGSGAVNRAQGGSFGTGALLGAAGSGIGQGIQALAAPAAETALNVRALDRAYGRTPGQFIIERTTGTSPAGIARQAGNIVEQASRDLETGAINSPVYVDLTPARTAAADYLNTALLRNNPAVTTEVEKVGQQLATRGINPIQPTVPAIEALQLKRGLQDLTTYNPLLQQGLGDAAVKGTIRAMQPELTAAIPNYAALNQTITNALPIAQRASAADLNAGLLQRIIGRAARPTGALAGGISGAYAGNRAGGLPGAIAGGLIGLVAPEVATSPSTIMWGARLANAYGPLLGRAMPAGALQLFRRPEAVPSP